MRNFLPAAKTHSPTACRQDGWRSPWPTALAGRGARGPEIPETILSQDELPTPLWALETQRNA